jgi:hypothetical protein
MINKLVIALLVFVVGTSGSLAADKPIPPQVINKHSAPTCGEGTLGPVVAPAANADIAHQYLLLLIFKKGKGSKYFGNASFKETGCIPDVAAVHDSATKSVTLAPTGMQMPVSNCPNDCVNPLGEHTATDDSNDPLNTNSWGILSPVDTVSLDGGAGRRIEIWQIAVTDACHARMLYKFHTMGPRSLLSKAIAVNDMLGEVMVGYPNNKNQTGTSMACPAM